MATNNLIAGFAFITIDGTSYAIAGEGTYRISTNKRETLIGQDGVHGYSETPTAGMISWQGRDSGALSITDLNDAVDVTVQLELANGKNVIARNAWRAGDPVEVSSENATFNVVFESADVKEVK
ncbi:phage tail tube protein [Novosphingobium clariflavum]|uniref:Phage tail tube protein n=1 Tax=Novosphingobium clariflavum TaxID=2029884 RepID=A0ABV6S1I5_9SPHN|nr:phage tail tube protein [Novosphingobium clariflavum]